MTLKTVVDKLTPAMMQIKAILEAGAASAMTLEQIIQQELSEWLSSPLRYQMIEGDRYYRGQGDITNRVRKIVGENGRLEPVKNLANNKLMHNFLRKLTDQKVGYLLSKPLSIQTDNETYHKQLGAFFDKSMLRLLQTVGKEAINKGKGWIHVYYDESGKLSFKRIPSEEGLPLWKDAAHTELDAFIRAYDVVTYEGTAKRIIKKVEFWDTNGVKYYVLSEGTLIADVEAGVERSHFSAIVDEKEQAFNWERVPFVALKYNDEELPLIQFLKSLVDDYDLRKSDNSNNLEDLPNSIYVVKGYDGTDPGELRKNLSTYRIIKVRGDEGSGVDTLSLVIDTEAYKTHMEMNRKDIYEFGRGVDTQAKEFGNSPSGVTMKFLYADLDMDANTIETEFQASLEQLRWFIDTNLINSGVGDFSRETVDFIFNRDIVINETDTITNAKNSVGLISDETIVSNHPWVTDSKKELDRIKKQKDEESAAYGGMPPDTVPAGGVQP